MTIELDYSEFDEIFNHFDISTGVMMNIWYYFTNDYEDKTIKIDMWDISTINSKVADYVKGQL